MRGDEVKVRRVVEPLLDLAMNLSVVRVEVDSDRSMLRPKGSS